MIHQLAIIDLGSSIFAAGQAYVALSRVWSFAGMLLLKLDSQRVEPGEYVMMLTTDGLELSDGADESAYHDG